MPKSRAHEEDGRRLVPARGIGEARNLNCVGFAKAEQEPPGLAAHARVTRSLFHIIEDRIRDENAHYREARNVAHAGQLAAAPGETGL